jgi:hypothetical protein
MRIMNIINAGDLGQMREREGCYTETTHVHPDLANHKVLMNPSQVINTIK